jgi:protein-tyrosine phosphatase
VPWDLAPGVVVLPDGRTVRARGLRHPPPPGPDPDVGYYLLGKAPPPMAWETRWIRWPDFRLPADRDAALAALRDAHDRAESERVELACNGGVGRTGTALAVLAVLSGVDPEDAVGWVREAYDRHAVETPGQKRWVRGLAP